MSDFHGTLTTNGAPRIVVDAGAAAPEEHLGCQILVHGYIAARNDLGARLGFNGLVPSSDAELLAHAYRRWGRTLPTHVHGEYAAVICDLRAGTALLTHDALGLKALFHTGGPGSLAFATNLGDLADGTGQDELDHEYFADFLTFGFITGARTPFEHINRLLPGASLWWNGRRVEDLRSWNLNDVEPLRYAHDADYEEHFCSLFEAGVRGSLASTGPTWISLSGGLDSSSIACMAARSGANDLAAYSVVCSTWPEADERVWMRDVVESCGMPWHPVELETMLPFSELPGGPYGEPTQAVIEESRLQTQNALLTAHGAKVMLTGHAGDAVLCASPGIVPHHLADPLFAGRPLAAMRAVTSWRQGTQTGRSQAFWILRGLVEPAVRHLCDRRLAGIDLHRPLPPWLRRDYAIAKDLKRRVHRQVAPSCRAPGLQALSHDLWVLSLATATIPRQRMTFEVRNPILYLPLVEFMAAVPWEQKLRPDCDRYLQRRALRNILPESVRQRTDKGNGNVALVEGLRRSREWLPYLCDRSALAEHGIVDFDAWRRAVRQASVGHTQDDKFFLAAVAIEVWLRQWSASRGCRRGLAPPQAARFEQSGASR
jgi:asparagine synthase (glutamine-hydrolysing)